MESPIKIGELKKTLNIPNKSWGSPIHNGLNLMKIHVNAISKNNITQEFHLKLIESTLFQFNIKTNFLKLFQKKMYMALMVYHVLWKNENAIDVTNHKIIQIFTKDIMHHIFKNNMRIGKAKGHHNVLLSLPLRSNLIVLTKTGCFRFLSLLFLGYW